MSTDIGHAGESTIVSIGRNLPTGGMLTDEEWCRFGTDVLRIVRAFTETVHFFGTGAGIYGEETEESVTVVGGYVPAARKVRFARTLARLADSYGQECVAITYGPTLFAYAQTGG